MKIPEFNKEKLPEVMSLIDEAAALMAENDCENNNEARQKLADLQIRLQEITKNKHIEIRDYQRYWSYTNLETVAKMAMFAPPEKSNLSDEAIKKLIMDIAEVKYDEATTDYFLKVLEVEIGFDVIDYIFNPEEVGMDFDVSIEEAIEKLLADRDDREAGKH